MKLQLPCPPRGVQTQWSLRASSAHRWQAQQAPFPARCQYLTSPPLAACLTALVPTPQTNQLLEQSHIILGPQNSDLVPLPAEPNPCGVVLKDRLRGPVCFGNSPNNRSNETEGHSFAGRGERLKKGSLGNKMATQW